LIVPGARNEPFLLQESRAHFRLCGHPREDFVQAYYQLRVEGLRSPEMEISLEARNRILEDLGVTEDDLLNFAEVWGSDGEVMQEIWQEVDSLMREARRERAEDPSIEGYEPRRADTVPRGVGR